MTEHSTKRRAPVVALRGDIDVAVADRVLEEITSAAGDEREVTVDLSAVTFMDSSGISALLQARGK
jgi:anti-anti-sigma factor